MTTVKTAISLPAEVFHEVELAAREMGIARSQLVALALDRFLTRRRRERLLREINEAYADSPDEEEQRLLEAWRRQHRARRAGDW